MNFDLKNLGLKTFDGTPIINKNEIPLNKYLNKVSKKVFDYIFSLLALFLLSPLIILVILAIKTFSKGPVFYTAKRVARNGEEFKILKFRTMGISNTNDITESSGNENKRITKIGKYLRKFDIDEFPQIFNVLKGEMSIVGPRPHGVLLDKKLQNEVDNYLNRQYIKPGITGLAAIEGWRGPMQSREQKLQRLKFDLMYLEKWTFWLDLKIIFFTIFGNKVNNKNF